MSEYENPDAVDEFENEPLYEHTCTECGKKYETIVEQDYGWCVECTI
jgi:hypothetical protein